jgi:hypothetical protein
MKTLIAAALLLLAATSNAGAVGMLADVTVYDRTTQRSLPVYWSEGGAWMAGTPGNEYAIRIRNRSAVDLLAVISVDGVNAITGATASPDQSGYIVPAYGSVEIKGWRKSMRRVASFYFTDLGDSYAARTGRPDDVGVIGVALFKRKPAPELHFPELHREQRKRERGSSDAGAAGRAEAPAFPSAPSASNDSRSQARAAEKDGVRPSLGTGHGRSQSSHVRYAEFERESSVPNEVIAVRYDSRENLVAMGILRAPRRGPDPFPAGFVPDPG